MTDLQAEVILALADNGLKIRKAAQQTYRNPNTIRYHIQTIREKTGLDPLDFWDMQKLVPMAKEVLEAEQ